MSYATPDQARAAGASGTDTQLGEAIAAAEIVIDRYCRDHFEPAELAFLVPVDVWGMGYLPVIAYSVTTGELGYDGRTWTADGLPPFPSGMEFLVAGDYGWRACPLPVTHAAARLAALYAPVEFTAQADAEGNPIGRPPAPTVQDESDPGPPGTRQGGPGDQRTTGDLVVDAWLEPYKQSRVLI